MQTQTMSISDYIKARIAQIEADKQKALATVGAPYDARIEELKHLLAGLPKAEEEQKG